jgi:predicted dehydrogenase
MTNSSSGFRKINRRRFLATSAALSLPVFLPKALRAQKAAPGPNDKINVGVIGSGGQGTSNARSFLDQPDCRVVAACDVDKNHLQNLVNIVNRHYQNKDCTSYHDFRELLARPDIDAVMLAVPDHWHEIVSVEAARQKKHIYGEKPLAKTIAEQQAIVRAVQANDRIWQTGSWQRSTGNFHKGAEIVRNGLIGQVTRVEVGLPYGHNDSGHSGQYRTPSDPPPELDYDFWIGPSKMRPYVRCMIHKNWRWNYNTGGGQLMDWVGHHVDIAHWGLGFDRSGPSEVEGQGEFPPADALWNTCTRYRLECKYPNNVKMIIAGGYKDIRSGTKWIGDKGWVYVDRGKFESSNEDWEDVKNLPEDERKTKLPVSTNHFRNFLDAVRSREPAIAPVETAHHSAIPGHLGLIAMMLKRKIRWDVATETIQDDPEATAMLTRPFRPPWKMGEA